MRAQFDALVDFKGYAGVEPLPDDEARERAEALMELLAPAFEVSFQQH